MSESNLESGVRRSMTTQTIRVAVKRSARDTELFVARLLEGEEVPGGMLEAFLVLRDPNAKLV